MVSECVVSETGVEGGEVFLSFNRGKSNDRVHFDDVRLFPPLSFFPLLLLLATDNYRVCSV